MALDFNQMEQRIRLGLDETEVKPALFDEKQRCGPAGHERLPDIAAAVEAGQSVIPEQVVDLGQKDAKQSSQGLPEKERIVKPQLRHGKSVPGISGVEKHLLEAAFVFGHVDHRRIFRKIADDVGLGGIDADSGEKKMA